MLDLRPVFLVIGAFLATLGCAMLVPALVDLAFDHPDWPLFVASALITVFFGVTMWVTCRGAETRLGLREAFVLTTFVWVIGAGFAALPLYWAGLNLTFTDAYFEAMSGLTTTGSTVIVGLDNAAPGLLLWRAILQWIGGIGIVVTAVAVLPMLQIGGMQYFRAEAFDTPEKILPRASQLAGSLIGVYLVLTAACAVLYAVAGITPFDAIAHSMTTVATAGFSTKDASFAAFGPAVQWIAIVFMAAGALPFMLYVKAIRGNPRALFDDEQVRAFFVILGGLVVLSLFSIGLQPGAVDAPLREVMFNMVSIMTGTGYATTDFNHWGPLAVGLFFTAMFIGGCTGSTSCGMKVFRFVVMFQNIRQHAQRIVHPSGIFVKRYNGRPLSDNISAAVLTFVFLYLVGFAVLAVALSLTGVDAITAASGAATAISNVGPGLGPVIGPAGNFASLPDTAKWLLTAGMLIGRLEILTVLVLFIPAFWHR